MAKIKKIYWITVCIKTTTVWGHHGEYNNQLIKDMEWSRSLLKIKQHWLSVEDVEQFFSCIKNQHLSTHPVALISSRCGLSRPITTSCNFLLPPRQYRVMNSLILDDFIVILENFLGQLMMPFFLEEYCDCTENRDSALRRLFRLVPVVAMTWLLISWGISLKGLFC